MRNVAISPNARWITLASVGERVQLLLLSRDGRVRDHIVIAGGSAFVWVGDTAIAWQSRSDLSAGELIVQRIDPSRGRFAGAPTVLVTSLPPVLSLSYDATGALLWTTAAITDELHRISLSAPSTSQMLARSRNAYLGNPTLSPDGQRVAYIREDALGSNAYFVDVRGGAEQMISSDTVASAVVRWPSAQHVVRVNASGSLASFDLATGRSRAYAVPSGEYMLGANANTWLFVRNSDASAIRRDSMLQHPRELPRSGLRDTDGALSPDGRLFVLAGRDTSGRFAFAVYSNVTESWSAVTPIDTLRRRTTNIANDGTIYFTRFSGHTELWRTKVGGPLTPVSLPAVQCYEGSITVSDRGDQLYCNLTTNTPDAYMVTLAAAKR